MKVGLESNKLFELESFLVIFLMLNINIETGIVEARAASPYGSGSGFLQLRLRRRNTVLLFETKLNSKIQKLGIPFSHVKPVFFLFYSNRMLTLVLHKCTHCWYGLFCISNVKAQGCAKYSRSFLRVFFLTILIII
jgi:hypothetical protein